MLIEAILIAVIALLVFWIYYSGGGTFRTRKLTSQIERLKEENQFLRDTNETLRSNLGPTSGRFTRPVARAARLAEELVKVKEALRGSESAKSSLEKEYGQEVSQELVQEILASEKNIGSPLKRRLAHEILVGSIGRDILKGLNDGKSLEDSIVDSGVPLRIGRERTRLLKETGYLDNKLNLTDWGSEVLEL
ncbi:hypothetical protein AKJ64_00490 [candidate division MSBL1 archaeon SCGC-AAA259E17]|uniref:Uncharacterized protein n=1 Tax=candidate division MSBL1 archaeon SCGC-AAA259E17 TaxID=1698263 RepID=A0A133UGW8_9EURY|nr:hypothetical protein AKJ64_00490 [candidate division MSBL1 archaeon SCGC-AAA259E17]